MLQFIDTRTLNELLTHLVALVISNSKQTDILITLTS